VNRDREVAALICRKSELPFTPWVKNIVLNRSRAALSNLTNYKLFRIRYIFFPGQSEMAETMLIGMASLAAVLAADRSCLPTPVFATLQLVR
jgi:hypothetical protein